jgi:hypothetical protein
MLEITTINNEIHIDKEGTLNQDLLNELSNNDIVIIDNTAIFKEKIVSIREVKENTEEIIKDGFITTKDGTSICLDDGEPIAYYQNINIEQSKIRSYKQMLTDAYEHFGWEDLKELSDLL